MSGSVEQTRAACTPRLKCREGSACVGADGDLAVLADEAIVVRPRKGLFAYASIRHDTLPVNAEKRSAKTASLRGGAAIGPRYGLQVHL